MSANCYAIIAAAGMGSRMGLGYNKAYMPLDGQPVLLRTLDTLMNSGLYAGAVIVIRPDERAQVEDMLSGCNWHVILADGGDTRQASVRNGLAALPEECGYVAVHDAARPFVTRHILKETLKSAIEYGSGVACTKVTDTIKQVDDNGIVHTLNRDSLRAVQTPQVFEKSRLIAAHEWAHENGISATDDSALVEMKEGSVHLVATEDGALNIKLTTPADIDRIKKQPTLRTGMGYDAHRLVEGRKLILCGVDVPYERGLLGHSDADVATHALIDALLGAAGLGDIGRMFPDSDMQFKDISSIKLLRAAVGRINDAGISINNCDITIVAQRPKLLPYIDKMQSTLADAMGIDKSRVNVKGKTTEGMGFEGTGEGMSAYCAASVIVCE